MFVCEREELRLASGFAIQPKRGNRGASAALLYGFEPAENLRQGLRSDRLGVQRMSAGDRCSATRKRRNAIARDRCAGDNSRSKAAQAHLQLGRCSIVQGVAVKQRTGEELLKAHVEAFADRVQGLQLHRSASLLLDRTERRLRYAAPIGQFVFCHVPLNALLFDSQCYRVL